MSKNHQTLEIITIGQIDVSKTNPRKHFDEKALKELTESIQEHGILQPILVRPKLDIEADIEHFELVCGERRYRAAILAGLEEIPVNIRVLTDDEAFELQIVENLERKDVHPLDEADAFKKMIDSGKYTIADVAAKMAKSESFIAQRLKLVDLIEEVRTDFMAGHLGIGHAILIARCTSEKQLDIYNDAKPWKEDEQPDYGTISKIKETIEDDSFLLSDAKFDVNDSELVKGCVACSFCPKRSGVNPVLFEDMAEDRCFDEKCYKTKEQAFIEKEVAKIIHEAQDVALVAGYDKPSDLIIELCKQFGVKIYSNNEWANSNYGNYTVEKNAFNVSGNFEGEYKTVFIQQSKENESVLPAVSASGKTQSSEEIELRAEFEKIETRQKRALELDDEKIWEQVRNVDTKLIKEGTKFELLQEAELNAVCFAMINKMGYYAQKELKEKLNIDLTIDFARNELFNLEQRNLIIRAFLFDVLPNSFGTINSCVEHTAYEMVIDEYFSSDIDAIKFNQKEIADKRIAKAEARKSEILAKLEKLIPVQEVETVSEEVSKPKTFKSEVKVFDKVSKKYSLNNSYFKNMPPNWPRTPIEVAMYVEQHNELPFNMDLESNPNWLYDTYIEYQKRNGVYHSQFFTPPATALRIAEIAQEEFSIDYAVLDACSGFGMLTTALREKLFVVTAFDFSLDMVDLYNNTQPEYNYCPANCKQFNYEEENVLESGFNGYTQLVANPPYEVPKLTKFLEVVYNDILTDNGKAILLLPKGFVDKDKPKTLVSVLEKFEIISREDMTEDFGHTKIKAEIVVLSKK